MVEKSKPQNNFLSDEGEIINIDEALMQEFMSQNGDVIVLLEQAREEMRELLEQDLIENNQSLEGHWRRQKFIFPAFLFTAILFVIAAQSATANFTKSMEVSGEILMLLFPLVSLLLYFTLESATLTQSRTLSKNITLLDQGTMPYNIYQDNLNEKRLVTFKYNILSQVDSLSYEDTGAIDEGFVKFMNIVLDTIQDNFDRANAEKLFEKILYIVGGTTTSAKRNQRWHLAEKVLAEYDSHVAFLGQSHFSTHLGLIEQLHRLLTITCEGKIKNVLSLEDDEVLDESIIFNDEGGSSRLEI